MYPALAVLKALGDDHEPVLWVGGEGGMEADLVARFSVDFTAIPAAGVHGVGLRALPGNIWHLVRGIVAARRVLARFSPDVIFYTGGYVSAPLAVAGWRTPSLVFCPDISPGLALQFVARIAQAIAVPFAESRQYFPARKKVVETGYPTRPELTGWERAAAINHFGLADDVPVVLVTGGSKGAQTINTALRPILPALLEKVQIIHITGQVDWSSFEAYHATLPKELAERYHPFAFLKDDMGAALAAANLAVSRAGASTLGEYPLFGLPAILIPYPFAWRYQKVNATFLEERGAAIYLPDEEMSSRLAQTILDLIASPARLEAMRQSMRLLARPAAAAEIASLLHQLAGHGKEIG